MKKEPKNFQFYDELFINETVTEISENLIPARITSVKLLFKKYPVINLVLKDKSICRLYFSTERLNPFLMFTRTRKKTEIDYDRNSFVDFLNKVLKDSKITGICSKKNLIVFKLTTMYDEYSDAELIYEVDTKYSNLLLVRCSDNMVVACSSSGGMRDLEKGAEYNFPEIGKIDLKEDFKENELKERYESVLSKVKDDVKAWLSIIYNYSYLHMLAAGVKFDCDTIDFIDRIHKLEELGKGYFIKKIGNKKFPYLIQSNEKDQVFDDLEKLYSSYIDSLIYKEYEQQALRVKRKIIHREKKLRKRLSEILKKKPEQEKVEYYHQMACSLLAKGNSILNKSEIEIENQFTQKLEKISVTCGITYVQNAEKFFKRSKKEKKRIISFHKQQDDIETRVRYFQELLFQIDDEIDFNFLETLNKQLFKKGKPIKSNKKTNKFIRFSMTSDAVKWLCYLAKNAVQNEKLLSNVAKGEDFWFHSFEVPGGHIIVKNADKRKKLPEDVIEKVSKIAGYFSKFRNDEYAVIANTQVKYLTRPPRHPPGFVIMNKFKTHRLKTENELRIAEFLRQK